MSTKRAKRKIKIVQTKLGNKQALGLWEPINDSSAVIKIDERLKGFQRLLIIIHESLHEVCPDWTEEKVKHSSEILASLLWKCDYRHVDHQGVDVPKYVAPKNKKVNKPVTKTYEKKAKIKVRFSSSNKKVVKVSDRLGENKG
jgi:hypothetical protein